MCSSSRLRSLMSRTMPLISTVRPWSLRTISALSCSQRSGGPTFSRTSMSSAPLASADRQWRRRRAWSRGANRATALSKSSAEPGAMPNISQAFSQGSMQSIAASAHQLPRPAARCALRRRASLRLSSSAAVRRSNQRASSRASASSSPGSGSASQASPDPGSMQARSMQPRSVPSSMIRCDRRQPVEGASSPARQPPSVTPTSTVSGCA